MNTLAAEIERQPSIFPMLTDAEGVKSASPPFLSDISRGRNGVVALSGALILFGISRHMGPLNLRWYSDCWNDRNAYNNLLKSDTVFGCDVFGDLLFCRSGSIYRLDGELGEVEFLFRDAAEFGRLSVEEASELFGGSPARDAFSGGILGDDPLRLKPIVPFVVASDNHHGYSSVPLTQILRKKALLSVKVANLDDGDTIDLDFWNREE